VNGGASFYGPGVYQSHLASVSISYAGSVNQWVGSGNAVAYRNSQFHAGLQVLALCENVPGVALKQVAPTEWTQQDLTGLVVRSLMIVKQPFEWDVVQQPPVKIPSVEDCLGCIAEKLNGLQRPERPWHENRRDRRYSHKK
jgi:hypothetical protein